MARYRKVDPRIWNDEKFSSLSNEGKLVFFMLLTHPSMTALGAMRATIPGLAAELGWELEGFREAFREGLLKGMSDHDEKACLIALPNFLKYNPPESPNVIKAWANATDLLPECGLKNVVIQRSKAFAEAMSKGFKEALPKAFAKSTPYQEQEQEQEQEYREASCEPSSEPKVQEHQFLVVSKAEAAKVSTAKLSALASQIYTRYPRKVERAAALKAFSKAIQQVATRGACEKHTDFRGDLEAAAAWLRGRVIEYRNSPQGQQVDKGFIPYPSTWANGARYDDDEAEWRHVHNWHRSQSSVATAGNCAKPTSAVEKTQALLAAESQRPGRAM